MKRWIKIISVIAVAAALALALVLTGFPAALSKGHAAFLFRVYREEFEQAAVYLLLEDAQGSIELPGVTDADVYPTNAGCVDFRMGGSGLVPSSTYWGVVYTSYDFPVGFQGQDLDYTFDGKGWYWQEENGDNHSYVTKLDNNWYLYEMKF